MRRFALLAVPFLMLALSGCASFAYSSRDTALSFLYTDEYGPNMATQNPVGTKTGEACSSSILGWVTTGDSSIAAAAKNGGISRIGTVNHHFTNVIGIVATYCTIVTGD